MKKTEETLFRIINLKDLDLEPHVAAALYRASAAADGNAVTGGDAVKAILHVTRLSQSSSEAFSKFADIFAGLALGDPSTGNDREQSDTAREESDSQIVLDAALTASFRIAEQFWTGSRIWGRDLITAVLLTNHDETLEKAAVDAGRTLKDLRDDWFRFVATGDERDHRPWAEWWAKAGVDVPHSTFLLTWNPKEYSFPDLKRHIQEIKKNGRVKFSWSLGTRRYVSVGDRVFLLRQGVDPRGLVGSGHIVGVPEQKDHYDKQKKAEGLQHWSVMIEWDALSVEPILDQESLVKEVRGEESLWRSQGGGRKVPPEVSARLDDVWSRAVRPIQEGYENEPETDVRRAIAGVNSDQVFPDAVDHLGVEGEAEAFARVMASSDVTPPLSIGVFGEWGSGKTFFMEKMRAHVERLTATARQARDSGDETAYHKDIVQIRFNAWHYMETNLWASLVEYIFRELDDWLCQREELNRDQVDALYERLTTVRMLRLDAVDKLIEARRRRQQAEKRVAQARQQLAKAESARFTVKLRDFWAAVRETLPKMFEDEKQAAIEKAKIEKAAKRLGFVDVADSGKELIEALRQARQQVNHGQILFRSVASRLGSVTWTLSLLILMILAPFLLPIVLDALIARLGAHSLQSVLNNVSSTAMTIASLLAAVTGWTGTAVARGARALSCLSAFQDKLDERLQARSDGPHSVLQAEQVLALRRKEVEIEESNLDAVTGDLEQARSEFAETSHARLNRFIRDKIVDGDYAKHLGIIATVRKDFEELARIMADTMNERRALAEYEDARQSYTSRLDSLELLQRVDEGLLTRDEADRILQENAPSDERLKYFQRIILYVDDLDRCPPKKVVEVLQACHLLLCFPLFIVVVAVDARWVSRALLREYEHLLIADSPSDGSDAPALVGGGASPRDYLEKIFQIPYWVRHMHGSSSQDFAKELIGHVDESSYGFTFDAGKSIALENKDEGASSLPNVAPATQHDLTGPKGEADGPGSGMSEESAGDGNSRTEPSREVQKGKDIGIDPNPGSLRISSYERDLLTALAPHAGESPRTIKRFVNVYRCLRTGLPDDTLRMLVGEGGQSRVYRAILAQLAIVTGAPRLANAYFDKLGPPDEIDSELKPSDLLQSLKSETLDGQESEMSTIESALKMLSEFEDSAEMIREMRRHSNVVKRYSFTARPYMF